MTTVISSQRYIDNDILNAKIAQIEAEQPERGASLLRCGAGVCRGREPGRAQCPDTPAPGPGGSAPGRSSGHARARRAADRGAQWRSAG